MRRFGAYLIAALLVAAPAMAASPEEDARQYKIEAAFLYNFFNYITWPEYGAPAEMKEATVCVSQGDKLTPYLEYVRDKMASERRLTIRTLAGGESAQGCQLLFERSAQPRASVDGVLTISDRAEYLGNGGMIAIPREQGHLAIAINNNLLSERGFQASSRLLQLAKVIK